MNSFFGGSSSYGSLNGLSSSEINQLKNIGGTIISPASWTYLGILNQGVNTTSNVQFNAASIVDTLKLLSGANYIALKAPALTGNRTISFPNANVDLAYIPNQALNTSSSAQFWSLNISTAGGLTVNSKTPSDTQWGYLTGLNQALATTSTPQFAKLGVNQAAGTETLEVNGNVKCSSILAASTDTYLFMPEGGSNITLFRYLYTGSTGGGDLTAYLQTGNGMDRFYITGIVGSVLTSFQVKATNIDLNNGSTTTKIGINKTAGTEALEVNGNVKYSDLITNSNVFVLFMPEGGSNIPLLRYTYTGSTVGNDLVAYLQTGLNMNKLYITGNAASILDTFLVQATNIALNNGSTTTKVGINQAAGTEALEVNGNVKGNTFYCSKWTAIGYDAGANITGTTSSNKNLTLVGDYAGKGTAGSNYNHYCTYIGDSAGLLCNGGITNTAVGYRALRSVSSGSANNAIGSDSLYSCTTGSGNIGIGFESGYNIGTGGYNICIGQQAAKGHSSAAERNVVIGSYSGAMIGATTNSVLIGYGADGLADATNTIGIGYQVNSVPSNSIWIGNASHTAVKLAQLNLPYKDEATSFTAQVGDGTNSLTLSTNSGIYQKWGRLTYVNYSATWTANSCTGSMYIYISVLPSNWTRATIVQLWITTNTPIYGYFGQCAPSVDRTIYFYRPTAGSATNILGTDLPASGELQITGLIYV